ncbi:MAG: hypothetical protein ACLPPF_16545 [Rhodomicrobium sp.]
MNELEQPVAQPDEAETGEDRFAKHFSGLLRELAASAKRIQMQDETRKSFESSIGRIEGCLERR